MDGAVADAVAALMAMEMKHLRPQQLLSPLFPQVVENRSFLRRPSVGGEWRSDVRTDC